MKVIFVSGTYIQAPDGKPEVRLGPGSYMMQPGGNYRHTTACDKASDCVFFVESSGAFDLKVVEAPKQRREALRQGDPPGVLAGLLAVVLREIRDDRGLILVLDGRAPRPHLRHGASPGRGVLVLRGDQAGAVAQAGSAP